MKVKMVLSLIIFAITIGMCQVSYAAVEIVPSKNGKGTDSLVNTTVSNSFLLCRGMKAVGESLNGTTVDPHLATNKDWGAVSYLSNSIYGTNTLGKNTGVEVTIDNVKYYSTTTNITGVMNWGSNPNVTRYTQTALLISNYDPETSSAKDNVTELYINKDSKYVDYINPTKSSETLGMGVHETNGLYSSYVKSTTDNLYPSARRMGLFGGEFGYSFNKYNYMEKGYTSGGAYNDVTFRPIIWN